MKRQAMAWEKISPKQKSNGGFVSRLYEELLKLSKTTQFKNGKNIRHTSPKKKHTEDDQHLY
jgi:hypothetical protein